MKTMKTSLFALVLAALPGAAVASNYLGILKPPAAEKTSSRLYSAFTAPASLTSTPSFVDLPSGDTSRLKLGYRYSRHFAVEGEYVDFTRSPNLFASPAHLASSFRSTGFGVDTVATLPLWRFSFYGRMGAYHGDARNSLGTYSTSLLANGAGRGTRLRAGLGVRYDFSKSLGVRAEFERYTPLGASLAGDAEADQLSVGVSWRF